MTLPLNSVLLINICSNEIFVPIKYLFQVKLQGLTASTSRESSIPRMPAHRVPLGEPNHFIPKPHIHKYLNSSSQKYVDFQSVRRSVVICSRVDGGRAAYRAAISELGIGTKKLGN